MGRQGLQNAGGNPTSSPFRNGPYTWDQQVTFTAGLAGVNSPGEVRYVDGTDGNDNNDGTSWGTAFSTIQAGVTSAGARGTVFVAPLEVASGATDPGSYAETIIIPATHEGLSLIGINTGRTQGGLPQVKKGSGTTALLTIRAPNCLIANMGFNGIWTADSTQSLVGILLDDDGSTKTACGTTIAGCHFKNCAGSTASTNASAGGAITWSAQGNAWQVLIVGNRFYKNVGDIVLLGTSGSRPQDVIIENNIFSGPAANVDCNLYLAGGSGMNGVIIRNNEFTALPAISGAGNDLFCVLTGCVGLLSGNRFACTGKTFGVSGDNGGTVPVTVFMVDNYQEDGTTQIARTS